MLITTVIFDYGCVLSLAPVSADFETLRKASGLELPAFEETYWRHRDAYDVDTIDASGYWQEFGRAAGRTLTPVEIRKLADLDCRLWEKPNLVMVEWVRLLREGNMKAAVISNMPRYIGDYLRRTHQWLGLFDPTCFSGELKIVKPDPAIFHRCLGALGETASRTLFIDDRQVNVDAARALHFNAIEFRSVEQLQTDLEPYGLAASLTEAQSRVK